MLLKIISFLASIILLFSSVPALPETPDVLVENINNLSDKRTADEINGASGTRFYIQRPKADKLNEVNAADFGISENNEDNYSAFQRALDYCASNPGTKLTVNDGTYYFTDPRSLVIRNCTDLMIDGSDATFVFSTIGYKISVSNSDCVEIRNINFDWNRDESPLASVVTVNNSSPDNHTLDLVFDDNYTADENLALSAIIPLIREKVLSRVPIKERCIFMSIAPI